MYGYSVSLHRHVASCSLCLLELPPLPVRIQLLYLTQGESLPQCHPSAPAVLREKSFFVKRADWVIFFFFTEFWVIFSYMILIKLNQNGLQPFKNKLVCDFGQKHMVSFILDIYRVLNIYHQGLHTCTIVQENCFRLNVDIFSRQIFSLCCMFFQRTIQGIEKEIIV